MDMRTFVEPPKKSSSEFLTAGQIESLGGQYLGTVVAVSSTRTHDRFTAQDREVPVVTFQDDARMILCPGMLNQMIAAFGHESDAWIGAALCVTVRSVRVRDRKQDTFKYVLHRKLAILTERAVSISADARESSDEIAAGDEGTETAPPSPGIETCAPGVDEIGWDKPFDEQFHDSESTCDD